MKHLTDHGQRGDGGVVRYRPGGHHGVGRGRGHGGRGGGHGVGRDVGRGGGHGVGRDVGRGVGLGRGGRGRGVGRDVGRGVGLGRGAGRGCRICETTSTIAPPFTRQAHSTRQSPPAHYISYMSSSSLYAPIPPTPPPSSSSQHVAQIEQVVKVQLLQIKINFLQQLHIREEVVCEKNSEMRTRLFHTHTLPKVQQHNTTYTHTQKQNNT